MVHQRREELMAANPYQAPTSNLVQAETTGVEVTWGRATKVWWAILWRAVLFSAIAGFVVGAAVGGALGAAGVNTQTIGAVGSWLGVLVSIPVGIWSVRWVLRASWSDFRIVLAPISK
jgi:hypothetical protein